MKTIVTHNGKFHADDLFAVAALRLIFPHADIARTRDEKHIERADCAVDVGGMYDEKKDRFDHHQSAGAGKRPNGIPYASFGLVWKKYGENISGSRESALNIDREFVETIDAEDNGIGLSNPVFKDVYPFTLPDVVSLFTPTWKEKEADYDQLFLKILPAAQEIIRRLAAKEEARREGEKMVEAAYLKAADKRLLILDEGYSWKRKAAVYPEPLFVVSPEGDKWRVSAVRDDVHTFVNRKDLPSSWAGKRDQELATLSGVPDAIFCHNNLFVAVSESKEGAIQLAKLAIDNTEYV